MILKNIFLKSFLVAILLCSGIFAQAQFTANTKQTFNSAGSFIENIGQYGTTYKGQETMGNILYGFEGHDMPILFTKKGIIVLQRKVEKISKAEEEKLEKQGVPEEEIEHKKIVTDRAITMEWIGANSNVEIIQEEKTYDYHTYGLIREKAYGYKKITYKNLYNGIDLLYSFINNSKIGFEYSLHVAAGADISQIKMQYGGDVTKIKTNKHGNLIIESDIDGIEETIPVSYYASNTTDKIRTEFAISKNEVRFHFKESYDNTKPIIIDPFISSAGNLDGVNAGKAKDIDFDYAGNVYVTGGGDPHSNHRLAKYSTNGILQWTFNGVLTSPMWQFGFACGGWVVEKPSGKIYLGQGVTALAGFGLGTRTIRLTTDGLYDNYITTADVDFQENWKMIWNCNNGTPQIFICGGGANVNTNLAVLQLPSTNFNSLNLTGILYPGVFPNTGGYQDIADCVIDPSNGTMYSIYASAGHPPLNNKIYCNAAPYAATSILWNNPSGYTVLTEASNKPYLTFTGVGFSDNAANLLAINPSYLFYWDGKNLKAFNKATGAGVGTPFITTNTSKMSGGIYADACNNVYVGGVNGTIKVYNFNGSIFSDAPADLSIAGYATKSVYDIAYNDADKLLYASGDGFVAAYDIAATCPNNNIGFSLNIISNCATASATAAIVPTPPTGSVITYTLFVGTTQIASNTTGTFTSLLPQTNYKITATINQTCSGVQVSRNFTLPVAAALPTVTPAITYCQGATATALTAIGTNLLWYTTATGGAGATTAPTPTTTTIGTTAYYVSQNTTGNCESPRAQINVQVTAALNAPIAATPITYCQGATATVLSATGTNLLWYTNITGGIGTITAPTPNTTTVGSTAYYVSQSNTGGNCESPRATINVNITPLLTANAGNTITIAAGTTTQLNAIATAGADYTWSSTIAPISLSNINILNPIANPLQTTTYLLTVKDVVGNCPTVSSSVQVIVIGTQNCINIRNAFTPNGDGINDTWLVYDQDYCLAKDGASVKVFNRYGSKVYENNAYKNTWDGTYNNKPLPDGTYYAVIVFTLIDGRKQYARADVTILR
jgi:gliding motility-associated-like protein